MASLTASDKGPIAASPSTATPGMPSMVGSLHQTPADVRPSVAILNPMPKDACINHAVPNPDVSMVSIKAPMHNGVLQTPGTPLTKIPGVGSLARTGTPVTLFGNPVR